MLAKIEQLLQEIEGLQAANAEELEALRIKYLSKKGAINELMADFRNVPAEQKKEVGMKLNELKNKAQERITTLEGVEDRAKEFGTYLAKQGGEQCGFCNPGFIMNVLAMEDELENPTEEDMKEYLAGNLCRCSGYESQLRAVKEYLKFKMEGKA